MIIKMRWREANEPSERGFQLAPQLGGREYVLQFQAIQRLETDGSQPSGWVDVEIESPNSVRFGNSARTS
jgi:hypothetical protein